MRKTVTFCFRYNYNLDKNQLHLVLEYLFQTIFMTTSHSKQRLHLAERKSTQTHLIDLPPVTPF